VLLLGHNNITGTLPSWIWNLPALEVLDLSNNYFSGPFSGNFSNLKGFMDSNQTTLSSSTSLLYNQTIVITVKDQQLTFTTVLLTSVSMDLSVNHLSGDIPTSIGELVSVVNFNLSSNAFVGTIPESIGDSMANLQSLDLSNNHLSGEIPQSFAKLSVLSVLRLANNNLTGRIPTSTQLQSQPSTAFRPGNAGLCGAPLSNACNSTTSVNATSTGISSNEPESFTDIFSVPGFAVGVVVGFVSVSTIFVFWEPARHFLHIDHHENPTGAWQPRK
jgi:LRR receptor-like serine/threonine-protein kinase FLS2